jgi:hypothetical protein
MTENEKIDYGYGWKFLTPQGTTESVEYGSFAYNLPGQGEKWSHPTTHPRPAKPDGKDCGPGRLHVMNELRADYAPRHWWPWFTRYNKRDIIGSSRKKTSVKALQLRRVNPKTFARFVRWHGASYADLSDADLSGANLSGANLSQCKNLPLPSAYLSKFTADIDGVIVYRAQNGQHNHPDGWIFEPGKFLTETPNPDRGTECGCGVNFATLEWARSNYDGPYWQCRIRWADLCDVVVPFGTDGKARCARLELIKVVE